MDSGRGNLVTALLRHGGEQPDKVAILFPDGEKVTFGEIKEKIQAYRRGLAEARFGPGDRIVVLFPICADFYALCLAMMASGLVVVFLDKGMSKASMVQALKRAAPKGIVSVDALLSKWILFPPLWKMRRYTVGKERWGLKSLQSLEREGQEFLPPLDCEEASPGTTALITYTSGTTGEPKGANRTHDLLLAQHKALAEEFPHCSEEVDMPSFPVVVLHNLLCGITTIFPDVDLGAPGAVEAAKIVAQIDACRVTRLAAAPAFLERLLVEVERDRTKIKSLQTLICGGAPLPPRVASKMVDLLPDVEKWIIYGSTEAEPIARVTVEEALSAEGEGYLVGTVAEVAEVILVTPGIQTALLEEEGLQKYGVLPGEVGELLVSGPHVLREYIGSPGANKATKVRSGERVWHRTFDLARFDQENRIWLMGRLGDHFQHQGKTIYPFVLEARLLELPGVKRAALLHHEKAREGEVLILAEPDFFEDDHGGEALRERIRQRVQSCLDELGVSEMNVDFIEFLPVDRRHNSKIDRRALRSQRIK